jgi:hypothetical protein
VSEKTGVLGRIELYRSLMAVKSLKDVRPRGALKHVMDLAELSSGLLRPEGLKRALHLAGELRRGGLSPDEDSRLHYYESVAWEKLRLLRAGGDEGLWRWEQPEIEEELLHLRLALNRDAISGMPAELAARVLSNTASLFHHMGRFSEAVELWDRALRVERTFSLARGKRGYALTHYARALYDPSHAGLFMRRARADLGKALETGLGDEAREQFRGRLAWVNSLLPGRARDGELELFDYAEGCTEEELRYRRWCLEHGLFLNPLNDLGPYPAGARDALAVPPVVAGGRGRGGYYHGFFNQLKQAYVSARYIYYEGVNAAEAHFADRDVLLFDTLDFPTYSLSVEKVKAAFGMAYSLFDKTARFINHYMGLSIPDEQVTFKTLWYRDQRMELGLRDEFRQRRNWPLRGLFWLGKDLHEDQEGFSGALEPGAGELSEIRYHLEHSYLKLHEDFRAEASRDTGPPPGALVDALAFSVHRGDFEAKTLKLLKLVRAALTYLCLAVHQEEKRLAGEHGDENLPAVILGPWDDAKKI